MRPPMTQPRFLPCALVLAALGSVGAAPEGGASDASQDVDPTELPAPDAAPPPSAAATGTDAAVMLPEASPPPATAPDAAAPPELHSAFVHLYADFPDAVLELRNYVDDSDWTTACRAPCDQLLRVEGMDARVSARGMTTSNVFRIEPGRGTAHLKVVGGSESSRRIGAIGFAGGIPVSLLGMGLWGYGKVREHASLETAGIVTLGVGAVMILGSLPFLSMGATRVRDAKGKTIATRQQMPAF